MDEQKYILSPFKYLPNSSVRSSRLSSLVRLFKDLYNKDTWV